MLVVVIIVFLSDKRIRSENRMKKKVVKPAIARGFEKFMPARWMMHFVPWQVRPKGGPSGPTAGLKLGLFSSKIGSTGENLRLVQPFLKIQLYSQRTGLAQISRPSNYNRKDFCIACSCRSLLRNLLHGLPWQFILRWGWTKIRSNMGQLPIEPALLKLDFFCSPRLWWISPIASWCHMVLLNLWSHFHVLLCVMGFWSVFIVTGEHCLSIAQVWPHLLRGFWCWLAGRVRCLKKTQARRQNDKILDRLRPKACPADNLARAKGLVRISAVHCKYLYWIQHEQCSKPWLFSLYRGLYYPFIWGF